MMLIASCGGCSLLRLSGMLSDRHVPLSVLTLPNQHLPYRSGKLPARTQELQCLKTSPLVRLATSLGRCPVDPSPTELRRYRVTCLVSCLSGSQSSFVLRTLALHYYWWGREEKKAKMLLQQHHVRRQNVWGLLCCESRDNHQLCQIWFPSVKMAVRLPYRSHLPSVWFVWKKRSLLYL